MLKLVYGISQLKEESASFGVSLGLGTPDLSGARYSMLLGTRERFFAEGSLRVFDGFVTDLDPDDDGVYVTAEDANGASRDFHVNAQDSGICIGNRLIVRYLEIPPSSAKRSWSAIRLIEVWVAWQS